MLTQIAVEFGKNTAKEGIISGMITKMIFFFTNRKSGYIIKLSIVLIQYTK